MKVKEGKKAPAMRLADKDGTVHDLAKRKGEWTLVYFYPKDDTPGCTMEAKAFAEAWPKFKRAQLAVWGVSPDSRKRHAKFCEKYALPFTLLSDEEKTTLERWGVWQKKKFMGREYMGVMRWSYLVGPDGTVVRAYETVKPAAHAEEVLADYKALRAGTPLPAQVVEKAPVKKTAAKKTPVKKTVGRASAKRAAKNPAKKSAKKK